MDVVHLVYIRVLIELVLSEHPSFGAGLFYITEIQDSRSLTCKPPWHEKPGFRIPKVTTVLGPMTYSSLPCEVSLKTLNVTKGFIFTSLFALSLDSCDKCSLLFCRKR